MMITVDTFLLHFPGFGNVSRDEIQYWLNLAQDFLNKTNWGKYWERAVELWAAHNIALDQMQNKGDGMGGLNNLQGVPASKSVDNVSKSYDTSMFNSGSDSANDGDYLFTIYGRRYLTLRNAIIAPATLL